VAGWLAVVFENAGTVRTVPHGLGFAKAFFHIRLGGHALFQLADVLHIAG
jgi:hypothetical protein